MMSVKLTESSNKHKMEIDLNQYHVVQNEEKNRFELKIGELVAISEYMNRPNMIVFTHTEVPRALEGKGVGSKLARESLDFARKLGKKVLPLCPFIKAYIKRHPAYQDLVTIG